MSASYLPIYTRTIRFSRSLAPSTTSSYRLCLLKRCRFHVCRLHMSSKHVQIIPFPAIIHYFMSTTFEVISHQQDLCKCQIQAISNIHIYDWAYAFSWHRFVHCSLLLLAQHKFTQHSVYCCRFGLGLDFASYHIY